MTYRDIINQMELNGDYSEARELEEKCHWGSCSEWDHVRWRDDAYDGMSPHTRASDCAQEAFDDIRSRERYEEHQREEAERERQEYEAQQRRAYEQQQEQEFYEQQVEQSSENEH